MIQLIKKKFKSLFAGFRNSLNADFETTKILQGQILGNFNFTQNQEQILENIHKAEFKVFSQWGDDGIIHFLTSYLEIKDKVFIEFGVENYTECNTKFLLMTQNWKGLIMDGSYKNMAFLKSSSLYWKYNIKALDVFVTAENINDIIIDNGFSRNIGILHIDIDGNDYWVWKAVKSVNPVIVIVEYNSIFGHEFPWTVSYDPSFIRTNEHYSNLLYGTSLLSICDLAEEKGYDFIGCNSNGNNAYFVRKDSMKNLRKLTAKEGYVESQFRESRDANGNLSFINGTDRLTLLKGKKIYNTRTHTIENI